MQTVEHVKAMPEALRVVLSKDEIARIQSAYKFDPLFPMNFLFNYNNDQPYSLSLTAANVQQYQMAAWINAPPKQGVRITFLGLRNTSDKVAALSSKVLRE